MEPAIKVRRVDFHPTDWLEGTVSLTHVERSVYITICAAIWAQGGPVAIDHVKRLCPGPGFKRGLHGLIQKCKVEETSEGLLSQQRAILEGTLAASRIELSRINGGLGGRPFKGLGKPPGFFSDNPEQKPNHQPPLSKSLKTHGNGEARKWKRASAVAPEPEMRAIATPHREPVINGYNPNNARTPGESEWRMRLQSFCDTAFWLGDWGPPPTDPRCWLVVSPADIPYQHLLEEFNFR